MRWVRINKAHFNADLITSFYWSSGKLFVYWLGETGYDTYEDPERDNYLRLCSCLGLLPIKKEDGHGEN